MHGNYKLRRQGGGRGAFAHVFVEVTPSTDAEPHVSIQVAPSDPLSLDPAQDPALFKAAIVGCQLGMEALVAAAIVQQAYHVRITALQINLVDTQPDAIAAAAYLAVASAFHAQQHFQLVFSDQWRVLPI